MAHHRRAHRSGPLGLPLLERDPLEDMARHARRQRVNPGGGGPGAGGPGAGGVAGGGAGATGGTPSGRCLTCLAPSDVDPILPVDEPISDDPFLVGGFRPPRRSPGGGAGGLGDTPEGTSNTPIGFLPPSGFPPPPVGEPPPIPPPTGFPPLPGVASFPFPSPGRGGAAAFEGLEGEPFLRPRRRQLPPQASAVAATSLAGREFRVPGGFELPPEAEFKRRLERPRYEREELRDPIGNFLRDVLRLLSR